MKTNIKIRVLKWKTLIPKMISHLVIIYSEFIKQWSTVSKTNPKKTEERPRSKVSKAIISIFYNHT